MRNHRYDWFYGTNHTPQHLTNEEIKLRVELTITGMALAFVGVVALGGAWLGGLI